MILDHAKIVEKAKIELAKFQSYNEQTREKFKRDWQSACTFDAHGAHHAPHGHQAPVAESKVVEIQANPAIVAAVSAGESK